MADTPSPIEHFRLNNGQLIPALGLGTWKSKGNDVSVAVRTALENGYHHIDTAAIYANEHFIGESLHSLINEKKLKREDVWITSKLWNTEHRKEHVRAGLKKSLARLQLDYLDAYLIHWSKAFKFVEGEWPSTLDPSDPVTFPRIAPGDRVVVDDVPFSETWRALEMLVDEGLVKTIGVCNWSIKQLEELMSTATIKPAINQVEVHPYFRQEKLISFCKSNDIHVTAYSPLGTRDSIKPELLSQVQILLNDPVLNSIATKYNATPANIALAWGLQRGTSVIPKSTTPERIINNLHGTQKIKLSDEDVKLINSISYQHRFCNPTNGWKVPAFDDE